MDYEVFCAAVRRLSPAQDEAAIWCWKDFVDECVEHEQFVGFEVTGDAHSEAGRWLEALHAGFCAVKESFSQEVTDALIGLGRESCCLYPGEMMQVAVCLENGVNARQIQVLMETGFLDADDPFSLMPRAEAERQMADRGIIPKSALERGEEKLHRTEHPKTAPRKNGRSLALVPGADRFHWLPEQQAGKGAGKETEAEEMER